MSDTRVSTAGRAAAIPLLFLAWSAGLTATVGTGIDEEAQLPYWEIRDRGMSLRLVQRLPDQTRGFFLARGFTGQHAERIAQSCVFQTIFRNTSSTSEPDSVDYNLREWAVIHRGQMRGMKTREDWAQEWQAEEVAMPAQIAFEWALFPTQQRYHPGDYNWGMSVFNLQPGSRFDLEVAWRQYDQTHRVVIPGMECAPDIQAEPQDRE
jgi:hypothetical protein